MRCGNEDGWLFLFGLSATKRVPISLSIAVHGSWWIIICGKSSMSASLCVCVSVFILYLTIYEIE